MSNYIKTLLLSTIMLVIGNNSNYCYSMENNNININQANRIRYSDQVAPTIDQMIKCANFETIDVKGTEFNKCFEF